MHSVLHPLVFKGRKANPSEAIVHTEGNTTKDPENELIKRITQLLSYKYIVCTLN